jgi:Lsr2
MAQRTIIELTDDLTGEAADETVRFAFDGKSYAIDLSTKNSEKFRKVIAPYVAAARRDGSAAPGRGKARMNGHSADVDPKMVRAWAVENGYEVSARGRVSRDLIAVFKAAGS